MTDWICTLCGVTWESGPRTVSKSLRCPKCEQTHAMVRTREWNRLDRFGKAALLQRLAKQRAAHAADELLGRTATYDNP